MEAISASISGSLYMTNSETWQRLIQKAGGSWCYKRRDVNSPKRLLKKKAFEVKMICCHQESILLWTKRGPEMDSRLFRTSVILFTNGLGERKSRIVLTFKVYIVIDWDEVKVICPSKSISLYFCYSILLLLFTTCLLFESAKSLRKPSLKLHLQLGWVGCQDTCIIFQGKNLFLY